MTKDVYLKLHGIDLIVTVEYEDNAVCGVVRVRPDGSQMALKCDTERFYDELEWELQDALEEELRTDYIAHCEMRMDAEREDGL